MSFEKRTSPERPRTYTKPKFPVIKGPDFAQEREIRAFFASLGLYYVPMYI
jgi:hypothetical protein